MSTRTRKPMNVGVVGLGDISDTYLTNLRNYTDIVKVAACTDLNPAAAKRQADRYGIPVVHDTLEALLIDPEIDVVLDLTTPNAHAKINLAALHAGKHVYTEKTLATSLEDGREILELAKAKGLRVGCAPDTWLGGRSQTLRALLDSGAIGSVASGVATCVLPGLEWFHPSPDHFYEPGVGALGDMGPYYLAQLASLLGPVKSVAAIGKQTFDTRTAHYPTIAGHQIPVNVDSHMSATLEYHNGAVVTLIQSFDVWDSQLPRLELYGTEGVICEPDLDPLWGPNVFGGEVWLKTGDTARFRDALRPDPLPDWERVEVKHRFNETDIAADPALPRVNSRGIGLVDMVLAIESGRPHRCSGEIGYHVLEVVQAIFASATERRFVDVESTFSLPAPLPTDFPDSEA